MARVDIGASLRAAASSLEKGDGAAALERLLSVWRETRDAALAEAIGALSQRLVVPAVEVPRSATQKEELNLWIERARRRAPADLEVLCAIFEDILGRQHWFQVRAAVDELVGWPDDPRFFSRARAWRGSVEEGGEAVQRIRLRCDKLLVASASAGAEKLRLAAKVHAAIVKKLAKGRALGKEERAAVERCTRLARDAALEEVSDAPAARDELLAAIYAAPADHARRLVLADCLQELGDPWGELITLQCGEPSAAAEKRQRTLIAKHGRTWLGGLEAIVKKEGVAFARGFPIKVRLRPVKRARVPAELDHREWATLEEIEFDLSVTTGSSFVSPRMTSVRRLVNLCAAGLEALTTHHADLPVEEIVYGGYRPLVALRHLAECKGLPALRVLRVSHPGTARLSDLGWLRRSALGKRLTSLVLGDR
jgi:uncharacterized protein (TIGR02996 family)